MMVDTKPESKQVRIGLAATAEIKLNFPVDMDSVKVGVLKMRRPKVRDLLVASKSATDPIQREIILFANLCEVAPASIEGMDLSDYAKLQGAYGDFTPGSKGGEN